MARILSNTSAECREQMTPKYGSDAGPNVLQLQHAEHSRSVVFRLWHKPSRRRIEKRTKETLPAVAVTFCGRSGSFIQWSPIAYLTTDPSFGCVIAQQQTLPKSESQLFRYLKPGQQQEVIIRARLPLEAPFVKRKTKNSP